MLVSGCPTLRLRGDLFGALCWGCLVACIAFACLLAGLCERSFCSLIFKPFFPLHPPLVSIWSGKYSTDWVQCDGAFGGGRSQGCHGYLLSRASLLPGSTNLFRHHLPSSSIVDEFNGTTLLWVYGSWDAHLASPADFFAGADDITKERKSLGLRSSNALHNL